MAGSEAAAAVARKAGLDFIGGIELSTRFRENGKPKGPSIHLLGYFPQGQPACGVSRVGCWSCKRSVTSATRG